MPIWVLYAEGGWRCGVGDAYCVVEALCVVSPSLGSISVGPGAVGLRGLV